MNQKERQSEELKKRRCCSKNSERKFLSLLMAPRPGWDGDRPPYH